MSEIAQSDSAASGRPSLIQNWVSLFGIILTGCSLFAVLVLLAIDFWAGFPNPYVGILTYIVAPGFLVTGLLLIVFGVLWERRRRRRQAPGEVPRFPRIDLNIPRQRRAFAFIVVFTFAFFLLTALGSYRTYHFTESVQFCGQTCHAVMHPEYTAYQNSPHARVACVQCHIGPGADWFVRSKLSGSYQVYAALANKYPRPIPVPIKNLRPAQETCEQCHWPKKFFGSIERINQHYLADEENTPWTIRLLMKVGGGDPALGQAGGIHWHMNIANKIEYIATDEARTNIPWVRATDASGKVTVYASTEKPLTAEQIAAATPRRMDCIDCHNRPSHIYNPPARSVNLALASGRIATAIPFIKRQAVEALTKEYKSAEEAHRGIAESLRKFYQEKYPEFAVQNTTLLDRAIAEVQKIYSNNFFPEMKVAWTTYPNHIGHTIFPGCYRCHDGKHVSAEGKKVSHDCNACHIIIAQGSAASLEKISPSGLEFEHPTDIAEMWREMNCHECHTGALTR